MNSSPRHLLQPIYLAWFACLLCLVSLSTAKAFQAISVGVLWGAVLWEISQTRDLRPLLSNRLGWWLSGFFLLTVLSYFYTENTIQWSRDMKGKLLFCLIPLGMGFFPSFPDRLNRLLWALFSLCQTVVAVISLYFYFQDFSQLNEAIGRNTTIDIIGRMSHIYFGFLLAFSVLVCGYMAWRFQPIWRNWERYVWMGIGLLNLLALHVLTSRTGLLVFYGGLVTVLLWPGREGLKKGLLLTIIVVLISLPFLSYQLLPSFRQRIDVSWYDLQQYQERDENIGDYSLAMRLVAWETGYQIFRAHLLLGVGPGDLETEMIHSAPQSFPSEKLLKNPHNQYIETAAAFGIFGLLLLLWVILYPLKQSWLQHLPLQITFLTMIAIGMLFESLFERQVGICLYSYFIYLLPNFHLSAPKEHSP